MEKISGIVPSSPRVTSVDLQNAGAARPGMPTFGRSVGVSSLAERRGFMKIQAKASIEHQGLMTERVPTGNLADPTVPASAASTVKEMSDRFFANRLNLADTREQMALQGMDPGVSAPSPKLVPKGSYVDVRV